MLTSAETLAKQSGIPGRNLTLINEETTYAHNDPAGGYPTNEFSELVPFLSKSFRHRVRVSAPVG